MRIQLLSACIGSLLLSACATNQGSFETHAISPPATKPSDNTASTATPNKPTPTDVVGEKRPAQAKLDEFSQPTLGSAIKIPLRNAHPQNQTEEAKLNKKDVITLSQGTLDIPFEQELKSTGGLVVHTHDNYGTTHKRALQYVRSGYIQDVEYKGLVDHDKKSWLRGVNGYVYYRGINPATHLPTAKSVRYTGTWDFVTDAKKGRKLDGFRASEGYNNPTGDTFGATSHQELINDTSHQSEFVVDFDNKNLNGKLTKNQQSQSVERYKIDAKLHGNRFVGVAKASNASDPLFGKDSKSVEGGFFGDNAEELAGKFMADDESVFAVFGAKQDNKASTQKAFDAQAIKVNDQLALSKENLDTFGNAMYLVVNGKSFALLPNDNSTNNNSASDTKKATPILSYDLDDNKKLMVNVCCHNLDYVQFGQYFYQHNGKNDPNYRYFLTGERTNMSDMNKQTGNAYYKGTWAGVLIDQNAQHKWLSQSDFNKSGRADFMVDFGKKSIMGNLFADNGVESMININGKIEGSGFSGTANTRTGGFNIDGNSTGKATHININQAVVKGGFYGPNAQELGGSIYKNDDNQDKMAAVFGAKRQTHTP